ncbi:MAG: hypothetical protein N3A68_02035 [Bacteroidia bacterium]|nr:hypothetical protein [Bacteroidia bacterium]
MFWKLYHPLQEGKGEALARAVATFLFSDSLLEEVAYIHSIKYRLNRQGPWFCIDGLGTPEGVYTFFSTLLGAMQRFPQRLQQYKGLSGGPPLDSLSPSWAYQWVYEDTAQPTLTALALSQAFFRYWREGQNRCVFRGKVPSLLLRAARQLTGEAAPPWPYVPPTEPSPLQAPSRQGIGVVYVRWKLEAPPTPAAFIALWAHGQALLKYLCDQKQLACRAEWVPLPEGAELWIETSLPVATQQAASDFLSRPFKVGSEANTAFLVWAYSQEGLLLSAWWACVWGLPKLPTPPLPPARELQKAAKRWRVVSFAVGF